MWWLQGNPIPTMPKKFRFWIFTFNLKHLLYTSKWLFHLGDKWINQIFAKEMVLEMTKHPFKTAWSCRQESAGWDLGERAMVARDEGYFPTKSEELKNPFESSKSQGGKLFCPEVWPQLVSRISSINSSMELCHLYTTYILPIGWLYATYHLLREPETTIEQYLRLMFKSPLVEKGHPVAGPTPVRWTQPIMLKKIPSGLNRPAKTRFLLPDG